MLGSIRKQSSLLGAPTCAEEHEDMHANTANQGVRFPECFLGDVGFERLRRILRFLLQDTEIYEGVLRNAWEHWETVVIAGCSESCRSRRGNAWEWNSSKE